MEFKDHLTFLRMCYVRNITKGALISQIYSLIHDHEGKDFNDLDDLFLKLYPHRTVQRVAAGVTTRGKHRSRQPRKKRVTTLPDIEAHV